MPKQTYNAQHPCRECRDRMIGILDTSSGTWLCFVCKTIHHVGTGIDVRDIDPIDLQSQIRLPNMPR